MSTTTPFDRDRYPERRNRSALSRSFIPLALITLGVVFLLGNMVQGPGRGGLVLLGLGAAFAIGRLTTGRYGYSVPAGILLAIGSYVSLTALIGSGPLPNSGWFFLLLGLGFVLVYVLGMRPPAIWPLFPATVLIGLGLILFGWASAAPLASFAWLASYWPAVLVLVGVWLLFREQLPAALRQPVATLGAILVLGYGLLVAIASVAAAGTLVTPDFNFGVAPFNDTITLDQPIAAGDTFHVTNSSGRTTIRVGTGDTVHVVATRKYWVHQEPPDIKLAQAARSVSLDIPDNQPIFGKNATVDYAIEIPASVQVNAQSSSGSLDIDGVQGAVQAETSSGTLTLNNIGGELRAKTSSGRIRGTQLRHVRDVQTSSGSVTLEGVFRDPAQIRTSSGDVEVKLGSSSATAVDVSTRSGDINLRGVTLANQVKERNALKGTLGSPEGGASLSIQTSSGDIRLSSS
ncbi:MAG TPA: DUF4097 family beta strand repeat-containing protein [Chloroflexota bacterium]